MKSMQSIFLALFLISSYSAVYGLEKPSNGVLSQNQSLSAVENPDPKPKPETFYGTNSKPQPKPESESESESEGRIPAEGSGGCPEQGSGPQQTSPSC